MFSMVLLFLKALPQVLKLSFHARESVPVLIITKNDDAVKELTDQLENRAGQQHLVKEDVIRPLSKSLFESNPRQYKENLRLSTRCYTAGTGHDKTWRITVTDPSGARGTDYRMDDDDADENGGLLLIVMKVPQSERDWIQYKGRTARQAWKGQYCVLLNEKDYRDSATLPPNVVAKVRATADEASCNELVDAILQGGLEKSKADLKKIQAVYNAGFVANEVCEKVWAKYPPKKKGTTVDVGLEGDPRSAFMKICRMYRYHVLLMFLCSLSSLLLSLSHRHLPSTQLCTCLHMQSRQRTCVGSCAPSNVRNHVQSQRSVGPTAHSA